MIELFQFRFSPYNEKVRWALDLKRVPHRRHSLLPGPHVPVLKKLSGQTGTPVLVHGGQVLAGSAAILEWLDQHHPEPRLLPADAAERAAALAIQSRFDNDLTPRGRRAVLDALLRTPGYFAQVFGDGRSALQQMLYGLIVPLAAPLVRKGNGIAGRPSIDDGLQAIGQALDFVARETAASGYLVGGGFTVADLTAASTLALCTELPNSPMTRPQPLGATTRELVQRFVTHPGLRWVHAIYARHRGAQRDFEGPSPY